ncbi:oligosaccharide flippase family protein [Paraburkholderia sp. MMS20-SJTR3]|uniref:Oligosaccharide flippase family protein n=1 Tax=Paraburkholderia sejongensis TaxID=2886946 RepID=A0ABS8JMW5_9BURK|nr:oligosaccharide flippase family protein [Paraburkholderia sp. MMS20-SJTR3]MCC8391232.1 oligosaccharide flippase family protein [Paraburkholderia sp. MMS20-SJTR3]
MERSIVRNIIINFAGAVAPTFVSLVTVPAYIHLLGAARYGVINLVWTLIGYFSVLDLGTSLATENQIAKARNATDDSIERIFWSAWFMNLATGIVGGALIYGGTILYITHGVKIDPAFQKEVLASLPWIAAAVPLANVSWVFAGAITGVERFASYNVNQTLGTALFQLLPLAAIFAFSASLAIVIPACVIARFIAAVLLGVGAIRALKIRRMRWPEWRLMTEIFRNGRWMLMFSGANMLAATLDRVLIGALLGARFVTYYATPQNLVTRLNLLPIAMVRTLFPRLSAASRKDANALAHNSLAFLNGAFTPCVIVALFALKPFLLLWLGPTMAASAPVASVLVLGVWLAGQSSILGMLIQAQTSPASVATVSWLQLPFFAGALWAAIHWYGIMGAGVVVVLKALFDYSVLLGFSKLHAWSIVRNMLAHLAFLLVAVALADLISALPLAIAVGLALTAANFGMSLHGSSELRAALYKLWTRVVPSANQAEG